MERGCRRQPKTDGDESAVAAATSLQRYADAAATRHGGRLVKLLGDGAMLRLTDATVGLDAALDLVETMSGEAVVEAASDGTFGFERMQDAELKGLPGPIAIYRVTRTWPAPEAMRT